MRSRSGCSVVIANSEEYAMQYYANQRVPTMCKPKKQTAAHRMELDCPTAGEAAQANSHDAKRINVRCLLHTAGRPASCDHYTAHRAEAVWLSSESLETKKVGLMDWDCRM